jgi:predicted Rossmann fold nucleotide-binding protein DprA/Smf involved in DNA uptake
MNTEVLAKKDSQYPRRLIHLLGEKAPAHLYYRGDISILKNRLLGFVCSIQCPGNIIIKTLDTARILRDKGFVVAGGFHSPMEAEVLEILLKGKQPVVLCPSRGIKGLKIGKSAREAMDDRRLLILSIFPDEVTRKTEEQAVLRNNFVAALSDSIWVPHASPAGKTWATVHEVVGRGQMVYTFDVEENLRLSSFGAVGMKKLL